MCASLIGVVTAWKKLGNLIEKNLGFLVSFSAGVFFVISLSIFKEVLDHGLPFVSAFSFVVLGIFLMWLLFKLLPDFHHHHNSEGEDHHHDRLDARRVMLGDAIHNIGDGVLLAVSFSVSTYAGVVAMLSVLIHELVQEMSEFFVLREAGFSNKKALTINFLVSGTIMIGILIGLFFLDHFESLEIPLLAITAGAFLTVVLFDLFPHSYAHTKTHGCAKKHITAFLIGFLLMGTVAQIFVHSHEEAGQGEGEEHVTNDN